MGERIQIPLLFIAVLLMAGTASAATPVSNCTTIANPGVYVLTQNLTGSTTCITIESSDVVFDGQGHGITGPGTFSNDIYGYYGIYVFKKGAKLNNVHVKNLTVKKWNTGIYYNSSDNGTITDSRAYDNNLGIHFHFSDNSTIKNTIADNYYYGIRVYYSSSARVIGNNASDNYYYGIYIDSSQDNTIANNTVNSNSYYGIEFFNSSNSNITNNNLSHNRYGVYFFSKNNYNTIIGNNITNSDYGIYLYYSSNNYNSIINNNASNNNIAGIYFSSSTNNTITNNTLNNNRHGVYLYSARYNSITDNNIFNNSDYGIYDAGKYNSLLNNAIIKNKYGIYSGYYDTIANNSVRRNDDYGIRLTYYSTVINNTVEGNGYGIYLFGRDNSIYNNLFNNTNNSYFGAIYANDWNTTKTLGTNIAGGPYLGGNFWAHPNGTGYSETCTDSDADGICDSSYTLATDNIDYLPLTMPPADITPPTVTIHSPRNTTYSKTTIDLNVSADEAISAWWYSLDRGANKSFTPNTTLSLSEGHHHLIVYAKDSAGNTGSAEVYFTVALPDTTPPSITFVSPTPANGSALNVNYAYINITADEQLSKAILEWNGINETMLRGSWYRNKTGLAEGVYTYRVYASDTAGNMNVSETRILTIDTAPPVTDDDSPTGWQNKAFVVNLTCTDALSGCNKTYYSADGGAWNTGNAIAISKDGNHTIEYYSTDNAGNSENIKTTSAALDTAPPGVTIHSPGNTTYALGVELKLNYSVNDKTAISSCWYSLDSGGNITLPNCQNTTLTVGEGPHILIVYANDSAGNIGYAGVGFTVSPPDTVPPGISFISPTPSNNSIINVDYVYVNITASEALNIAFLEWNGTNQTMLGSGKNWYINKTGLAEGTYIYRVYASDAAGNMNVSETRVVTIIPAGATPVSSCTTIDSPGYYVLMNNITGTGICIRIRSSNVVFDGRAHSITAGTGIVFYGVGVYPDTGDPAIANVTVKNLEVRRWEYGIYFYNIKNGAIINNNASGNNYGIYVGGLNNKIANNVVNHNKYGVFITYYNNNLSNNTANSNEYGIYLRGAYSNPLSGNNASNNTFGIYLYNSPFNQIANNTASSNRDGIYLDPNSFGNDLINNSATSNVRGIVIASTRDNTVSNNNVNNNTFGIAISDSRRNKIINNSIKENKYYDLSFSTTSTVNCLNTIKNNTGSGNRPIKYFNFSVNLKDEVLSELVLCDADNSNISNVTIIGSATEKNNGLFAYYTDNSNFVNINSSSNHDGIYLYSSSNNTIANSNINSNYNNGIYLRDSSNSTILNNTLTNNSMGISFFKTYYSTIAANNVSGSSLGIDISFDSKNNTITENVVHNNKNRGISVSSSPNYIKNNIADHNKNGIYINGEYNIVANNTANSNDYFGIYINGLYNNITDNVANNNYYGIYLVTNYNTITKNKISNNSLYGIYLYYAKNNSIYNNLFNNSKNVYISSPLYPNAWNTTRQAGTSIVGGPYIGGNYWATPSGTGFSESCTDREGDGICDSSYTLTIKNIDYLPLTMPPPADTRPPELSSPPDIEVAQYAPAYINWSIKESNPDSYVVYRNGTIVSSGSIRNISVLSIAVNTNIPGNWSYVIFVNDTSGNSNRDEVLVNVKPLPLHGVHLLVDPSGSTVEQGENATYNVTVLNSGNVQDSFKLYVYSTALSTLGATNITIPPGGSRTVSLRVSHHRAGTYSTVVRAVPAGDVSKYAEALINTTVVDVVRVTPDAKARAVFTGNPAVFNLTIENTGTRAHVFRVAAIPDPGLNISLSRDKVSLNKGSSSNVILTATSSKVGTYYVRVRVFDRDDPRRGYAVLLRVVVDLQPVYGVHLTVDADSQTVKENENATYHVTLRNTGNMNDTFTLFTVNRFADVATLSSSVLSLPPGKSAKLELVVASSRGGEYPVTVVAISKNDSSKFSEVATNTRVVYYSLTGKVYPRSASLYLGENVSFTLILENTGNVNDTAILTLYSPPGLNATLDRATLSLDSGEKENIYLSVKGLKIGNHSVVINVSSKGSGAVNTFELPVVVTSIPVYDFELSITPSMSVTEMGENATYVVTIKNTGNRLDNYSFVVSSSAGSSYRFDTSPISLPPGGSTTRTLVVYGAPGALTHTLVKAVSAFNATRYREVSAITQVRSPLSLRVYPPARATVAGGTATFKLYLRNRGNREHTFNLTLSRREGSPLPASLDIESVTLKPGEGETLMLTFNASTAGNRLYVVKAYDSDNPRLTYKVPVRIIVYQTSKTTPRPVLGVRLESDAPKKLVVSQHVKPKFLIKITNLGNVPDTYALSVRVSPSSGRAYLSRNSITLGPHRSTTVVATLYGKGDTEYTIRVTGRSTRDYYVYSTVNFNVQLITPDRNYSPKAKPKQIKINSNVRNSQLCGDYDIRRSSVIRSKVNNSHLYDSRVYFSIIDASNVSRSRIRWSKIKNSTIYNSVISHSNIRNAEIRNAVVPHATVGSKISGGAILEGNITLHDVWFNISTPINITDIVAGYEEMDQSIGGMENETLTLSSSTNVTLSMDVKEDFIGASLKILRGTIPPIGAPTLETGIYVDLKGSELLFNKTDRVKIRVYYDDLPANVDPSTLVLRYYNESTGAWEDLESSVNTASRYVEAEVEHFSVYGIGGSAITAAPAPPTGLYSPEAVLLANSVDLALAKELVAHLRERGIKLYTVDAHNFTDYAKKQYIIILGGHKAYEGVGEIVAGVLSEEEKEQVLRGGSYIKKRSVFRSGQVVYIFAGRDRNATAETWRAVYPEVAREMEYNWG